MTLRLLAVSAVILGVATAAPSVAQAQSSCGARDAIVARLGQKYGEVRQGGGLAGATVMIELWASNDTGSWTILKTAPNGVSCVMAVGEGWQDDAGATAAAGDPV